MKIFLLALVLTQSDAIVFRMDKVYNSIGSCEVDGKEIIADFKKYPVPDITKVKLACVTEDEYKKMMQDYQKYKKGNLIQA